MERKPTWQAVKKFENSALSKNLDCVQIHFAGWTRRLVVEGVVEDACAAERMPAR